jgi:hypothetical protein
MFSGRCRRRRRIKPGSCLCFHKEELRKEWGDNLGINEVELYIERKSDLLKDIMSGKEGIYLTPAEQY